MMYMVSGKNGGAQWYTAGIILLSYDVLGLPNLIPDSFDFCAMRGDALARTSVLSAVRGSGAADGNDMGNAGS